MKIEKLRYGHPDDKEKVSYYGELVWNIMRCMETMNTIIDHLNTEQPSQEPPIDCNCKSDSGWEMDGFCKNCGGYTPRHSKHKSNWNSTPLSQKNIFDTCKVCGWEKSLNKCTDNCKPHDKGLEEDLTIMLALNFYGLKYFQLSVGEAQKCKQVAEAILSHLKGER
jgi:hypothetical protein